MTLRSFVQPDEAHGTTDVSGMSREASGPDAASCRARAGGIRRWRRATHRPGVPSWLEVRHLGEVQPEVGHRAHHHEDGLDGRVLAAVLEQRAILLERSLQLRWDIGVAETTPRYEIGTGRHDRGRVELQEGQVLDNREQVNRTLCVEQLRPDGDPACLVWTESPHRIRHSEPRC